MERQSETKCQIEIQAATQCLPAGIDSLPRSFRLRVTPTGGMGAVSSKGALVAGLGRPLEREESIW
jgi:hypothetical protein